MRVLPLKWMRLTVYYLAKGVSNRKFSKTMNVGEENRTI